MLKNWTSCGLGPVGLRVRDLGCRMLKNSTSCSGFTPILIGLLLLPACGDPDSIGSTATPAETTSSPTPAPAPAWTLTQIEAADTGLQLELQAASDGTIALAYWANAPYEDGSCDQVDTNPPTLMRQALYYAWRGPGDGTFSVEQVDAPAVAFTPTGLSLAFDALQRPAIAYTGGEPQDQYCGANDAVLALRVGGTWSFETASSQSDDSNTGLEASDAGFVVGQWPGLAYDLSGNPAILHRDVHFGSLQHDDQYRADAEFAWKTSSSWLYEAVDPGEGAGEYGRLAFDPQGRPIALYALTAEAQEDSRYGIWAARREADGSWHRVRLHSGGTDQALSLAIEPGTGLPWVAFYSPADGMARVRWLTDAEAFDEAESWGSTLVGSPQYDEGLHPSLAFNREGTPALAYRRCKRITVSGEGCDPNDEAVVFADQLEGVWQLETVLEADRGSCGEYTALTFDPDGTAWIGFRCTIEEEGQFVFRPFIASKAAE